MKHFQFGNNTSKSSTKMKSSYNSRNKSFTYNLKNTNSLLSPIRTTSKKVYNLNPKNFQPKKNLTSFNDSTYDTHNKINKYNQLQKFSKINKSSPKHFLKAAFIQHAFKCTKKQVAIFR